MFFALCSGFFSPALAERSDSKYEIADPKGKETVADYLIVAPAAFVATVDALAEHRSKEGRKVGIVTTESIAKGFQDARAFVKFAAKEWKTGPKYLLLCGAADTIPSIKRKSAYQTTKFANEEELGTDHLYGCLNEGLDASIAVGRFPAKTKEELETMVAKTIAYETKPPPGAWRKKIDFITGEGGFNPLIDVIIEMQFTALVSGNLPTAYDLEVAYSKVTSKYCPFPPKFNANAVRLLNEGSLFYVYVGHGHRTGFDSLEWRGERYDIFDEKNLKEIEVSGGLPIMIVIACSTGEYDSGWGPCIGESIVKLRKGPAAFIGGSRITQPYANALFGQAFIRETMVERRATLGECLIEAKKKMLADDEAAFRKTADRTAGAVQGFDSLEPMRQDGVLHYNLFGDPALRIARPNDNVLIDTKGTLAAGEKITVRGRSETLAGGDVEVTFECARAKFARPLPKVDAKSGDFEKQIMDRYRAANEKVLARGRGKARDHEFSVELTLPAELPPGTYHIKVFSDTAIGGATLTVER